jgi:pimeloyl-ACP methyl ester carboxylesterase
VLLWIGGLGDGLLTVPYPAEIAKALPPDWVIVQVLLSSAKTGWGTSSLKQDAAELALCVDYLQDVRKGTGKTVIMGHSTGCQDVMKYLSGPDHETRPRVEGAIIQASVSDREALVEMLAEGQYESSVAAAKAMVAAGKGEEILPSEETHGFFNCPVTARRWLSLASPEHDGDDDYFSSDLTDAQLLKTFGSVPRGTTLCILFSGSDEYVPKFVDKTALVDRWIQIAKAGGGAVDEVNSGIIEGATHNLCGSPEDVVQELISRVLKFLASL